MGSEGDNVLGGSDARSKDFCLSAVAWGIYVVM